MTERPRPGTWISDGERASVTEHTPSQNSANEDKSITVAAAKRLWQLFSLMSAMSCLKRLRPALWWNEAASRYLSILARMVGWSCGGASWRIS